MYGPNQSRGQEGTCGLRQVDEKSLTLSAKRVVITVPLGVLQATDREVGDTIHAKVASQEITSPQGIANGKSDSGDSSVSNPFLGIYRSRQE